MDVHFEREILEALAESYHKSRKDTGDNQINRRTRLKPEKLYRKYRANDGDFGKINAINIAVKELSEKGYIEAKKERFGTEIAVIYLVDDKLSEIERYLAEKYGYISKDSKIEAMEVLIKKYGDASGVCSQECEELKRKLAKRSIPGNYGELEDVFKALAFIEKNEDDLFIREVSMKVYGDSKYFEDHVMEQVCRILTKYRGDELPEGVHFDEILTSFHIFKEPQRLSIKGRVILTINGMEVDISRFSDGIEFAATELSGIERVKILAPFFLTVENRTSYLRYNADDKVIFYLGGFANRFQKAFIRLVYENNPAVGYFHFGDIDAGGLWIHHDLCESTGVRFGMFCMSVKELADSRYQSCLHPLSENDRSRMQKLRENGEYGEVIGYMLEHNVKLEQEVVSLGLMGRL